MGLDYKIPHQEYRIHHLTKGSASAGIDDLMLYVRFGEYIVRNIVTLESARVQISGSQHDNKYLIGQFGGELISYDGVMVQLGQSFRKGPSLTVFVDLRLPPVGHACEYT